MFQVLYLLFALVFTAWALLYKRSRKLVFFIMVLSLFVLGFGHQGCTCSVGSSQNLLALLLGIEGAKIGLITLLLFILPIIASFFWGRVFCGGVCPLGAMQDIINVVQIKIPKWIVTPLRTVPLMILGAVAFAIIRGDGFLLCKYDFIVPLFRFNATGILLILTIVGVAVSMVFSRPFCQFACPYGELLGVTSLLSKKKVEITPTTCISCSLCSDVCVVNAIKRPASLAYQESKRANRWWLILFGVTMPLWIFLFSKVGSRIAIPSKLSGRIVRTQTQLDKFNGKPLLELTKKEHRLVIRQEKYRKEAQPYVQKGKKVGAIFGVIWGVMLLVLTRQRKNEFYETDKTECVSCGRCYNHCPKGIPKEGGSFLDTIFGHIRHRIKEKSSAIKNWLTGIALLLFASTIVFASILIYDNSAISQEHPMENKSLLRSMVKDILAIDSELNKEDAIAAIKDDAYTKEAASQDRYFRASQSQWWKKAGFIGSLLLLVATLKYRHNRYVLKTLKPKINKKNRPILSLISARILAVLFGVLLLAYLFHLFPKI